MILNRQVTVLFIILAILVLYKERGVRAATWILVTVTLYALIIGSIVNHTCIALGITFT